MVGNPTGTVSITQTCHGIPTDHFREEKENNLGLISREFYEKIKTYITYKTNMNYMNIPSNIN